MAYLPSICEQTRTHEPQLRVRLCCAASQRVAPSYGARAHIELVPVRVAAIFHLPPRVAVVAELRRFVLVVEVDSAT